MKNSILKCLSLGVAAGAMSLCNAAYAQMDAPAAPPMMADSAAAPTMMPMPVTGKVLGYYVDRAGYVSAMDVEAADGVKMVRFSPSMAQTLTSTYPVNSTATVYVTSSMMGGMTRYDLSGMGPNMPAPTAMMPAMMVSDLDLLKAEPFTTLGATSTRYTGKISGYVSDPMSGEVLAIVLDQKTLIRLPRESRLGTSSMSMAPEGITPLNQGADVVAYGLPEAPRYGAVSPYESRVIATGIAVNGRTLGPLGFGRVATKDSKPLLGFNLNIPFIASGSSAKEVKAADTGYMPLPGSTPMSPAMDGMAPAPTDSTTPGGTGMMGGTGTTGMMGGGAAPSGM